MDRAEHLKLDDLDLDDQTIAVIRERADALIETNARQAQAALNHVGTVCSRIYKHHADSVNSTCDSLRVFFKLTEPEALPSHQGFCGRDDSPCNQVF